MVVALAACVGGEAPGPADADSLADVIVATDVATALELPPPGPADDYLTDPDAWAALGADADPFASHRPAEIACPEQSWGSEGLTFEVDTTFCDYLSVAQPLLLPVKPDDTVQIVVGHFPLIALEPSEAHAAVVIDGEVAWEVTVPIPSDTQIYEGSWSPGADIAAGAAVVFHLHNHGSNNWFLATLRRDAASPE